MLASRLRQARRERDTTLSRLTEAESRASDAEARAEAAGQDARLSSAQKAAALSALDRRFRTITGACGEGIVAVDAEGRITYVNAQMARLLGTTPEELAGRSHLDLLRPEDRERGAVAWQERRQGRSAHSEYLLRRPDGTELLVESLATPLLDEEGHFEGAFAVINDVTERRRTEAALRSEQERREAQFAVTRALAEGGPLTEAAPRILEAIGAGLGWDVGAFWLAGDDGALTCLEVWQRDPAATADLAAVSRGLSFTAGMDIPGRVAAAGEPLWISDLTRTPGFSRGPAAARGGLGTAFALPVTRASRCLAVLEFFRRGQHAADPELLDGFTSVSRQLSMFLERQAAEEERERLLAREQSARLDAELANRAKDEFLATLSHELRTPLNAIVGWAHVLRSAASDPATLTRGLEVIERNAKSQARLIGDVLDVSRIVSGKLVLQVDEVELGRVVEATVDSLRPSAEARNLRIVSDVAPDAGVVSGDADRLQQVTWNLLSNAIKFTPEGGEVRVRLARKDSHVELVVSDDGPGIDASFLPHIFERFRQGDATSTRSHGGLGLGLAIVRHLVELHGGAVSAASDGDGRGATFTVHLPLLAPRSVDAVVDAPSVPAEPGEIRLDGLDILVVDDEADGRDLAAAVLGALGANVRTASTAAEAFQSLSETLPAVLLSDVEMPDEDGYSLIRRIRGLPSTEGGRLPAAAFTAYARTEDRARALAAGFDAHLSKPIAPDELAAVVARLAGRGA